MPKKRKRSVDDWTNRIDSSSKIYAKWHKDYKRWVQFFRGTQWITETADGQINPINDTINPIVVNYVFNTLKTMVPTLFFKNPKIFVHARRPEFQERSELIQTIVNYDWEQLKIKNEIKKSILRSLVGGIGWIETGYVFELEPEEQQVTAAEIDSALEGIEPKEEKSDERFTEFKIKRDEPFAISRSILDVRTDPFADVLAEAAWFAIREIKPLEFVKKDSRFDNTRNLDPNAKFDDQVVLNTFKEEYRKDGDLKFVEMWHVTDRWEGKTFTIARGHATRLRKFDTPEGYGLLPLIFNDDPEQPQPLSVVELMGDQQQEINWTRAYMLEHLKRSMPRIGYDETILTDESSIKRLGDSDLDELIPLPGPPNQIIQPINFPSIPADMFGVDSKLKEDMQIATGLTDFQRGQAVKVPSATEAQLIEQSSRLRVDEGLDVVGQFAEQISENIIKLRQEFTTEEQVIPIVGEDQTQDWKTYTKEEIQGEFEFTVEYGSTQKRDQDFEKNRWLQLAPQLSTLSASPNPSDRVIGRQLAKVFEIPAPLIEEIFPTQPGLGAAPQQAPVGIEQILTGLGG